MSFRLVEIRRYPVKGLAGQVLPAVDLSPGETLPHDRRYALAHGASAFDAMAPAWQPKRQFLQLMNDERLALLEVVYDDTTRILTLKRNGRQLARGNLSLPIGHELLSQFLDAFVKDGRGRVKIVEAPGTSFTDTADKLVSIINLASVRDIERVTRKPVDPRRFRANLMIEDTDAWAEVGWVGSTLAIGDARLEVVDRIGRCAATNVDPDTAERTLNIPKALLQGFGHADCGIYARVVTGGRVTAGDSITIA
jgi:uncharacterized protein YcbX